MTMLTTLISLFLLQATARTAPAPAPGEVSATPKEIGDPNILQSKGRGETPQ